MKPRSIAGPAVAAARPQTAAQRTGQSAEASARDLLERAGLRFVEANVRFKVGELDLVMQDGAELVFVEVRMRRCGAFGGAAGSIDRRKRLRLLHAANRYLLERHGQRAWPACRFDVVAFEAGEPNWIRGAFDAG